MDLALECAGSFAAGVLVTLAVLPFAAKWYLRRRLGGMLDLLGAGHKMQTKPQRSPVAFTKPSTAKSLGVVIPPDDE